MALPNSAEQPQPLGRVVMAVKDWVGRLGEVWVDAQVTEIKRRNGPTQFLTLRDRSADIQVSATASALVLDSAGPLPEGSQVTARMKPRVWDRTGSLSFECLEIRVAGEGRLLAQLEKLKRMLQAEGLFEPHLKKRLPFLPRTIGLVTGRASDAERDVLTNVERRWPGARFRVEHALVQGPDSAASVMAALARLDGDPVVDVIIVARGGGSLQDLLSFSDEGVVRAVAACRTPVVSAIGHEQDIPLVDFVADVRASTPTAAAALVVPDLRAELDLVATGRRRLAEAMTRRLDQSQRWLDDVRTRPVLVDPMRAFAAHEDRLDLYRHKLTSAIESTVRREESRLAVMLSSVRAMSPKATLERGYAIIVDADQLSVTSVDDVAPGTRISAYLADGSITADVAAVHEKE